jgi:hypothetical protein
MADTDGSWNRILKAKLKQPESVADFKARIALMMRERETGKRYSIIGAARSHPCVTRYGIAGPGREYEANPDPRFNAAVREQIQKAMEGNLWTQKQK